MKKFIIKTSISSLIILVILTSVNYWGDGAMLFHGNYEKKIASILSEGMNATNISNYDDRILQKEIINNIHYKPDIVIIGSSRTMLLNSKLFPNKVVINNSVTGASIEDIIAIYQMYKTQEVLPDRIIIGIDPWLLNANNGQKRWLSLKKEFYSFTGYKDNQLIDNRLSQLFSFSYFQASFRNLPNIIRGKSAPVATNNELNDTNTKLTDGSLVYGKDYREASSVEIENKVKKFISGNIYSIENFNNISGEIWSNFNLLCKDILKNNIELNFFLTPYHPLVYKKVKESYPKVTETENKIRKYAAENKITLFGSFNPSILHIKKDGFYDGMHCKEFAIKKIISIQKKKHDQS
ncbi:MAG: hypothetical protein L3J35_03075 [Bacteroidales bacterium]|nr:hypothetical protein [Bacteroidales bacterium]